MEKGYKRQILESVDSKYKIFKILYSGKHNMKVNFFEQVESNQVQILVDQNFFFQNIQIHQVSAVFFPIGSYNCPKVKQQDSKQSNQYQTFISQIYQPQFLLQKYIKLIRQIIQQFISEWKQIIVGEYSKIKFSIHENNGQSWRSAATIPLGSAAVLSSFSAAALASSHKNGISCSVSRGISVSAATIFLGAATVLVTASLAIATVLGTTSVHGTLSTFTLAWCFLASNQEYQNQQQEKLVHFEVDEVGIWTYIQELIISQIMGLISYFNCLQQIFYQGHQVKQTVLLKFRRFFGCLIIR